MFEGRAASGENLCKVKCAQVEFFLLAGVCASNAHIIIYPTLFLTFEFMIWTIAYKSGAGVHKSIM